MPDHPDHEQLAAFQAGDGDRRQRSQVAAHVAGCPSCAEVVAAVEQARSRLALLGEPELPAGLHGRLAGAVATEVVRGAPPRRPAWYRRPATWGVAAAALLLAALVIPLLNRPDVLTGGAGGGGAGGAAQEAPAPAAGGADQSAAGGLPVLRLTGEVTAKRLRATLASNPVAMRAYRRAAAGADGQRLRGAATPESRQAPAPTASNPAAAAPSTTAPQPCLAAATARAGRPLVPAFLVEGNFQERPATMLVTADAGQPSRADLWVFPQGDCSGPPLATERLS